MVARLTLRQYRPVLLSTFSACLTILGRATNPSSFAKWLCNLVAFAGSPMSDILSRVGWKSSKTTEHCIKLNKVL